MPTDDGYPTEEELAHLAAFEGSPHQLVEYVHELWSYPDFVKVTDVVDTWGRARKRVEMVTGGWSGNEDIGSTLAGTLFHLAWWESTHRGGLTVYDVPADQWDTPAEWGQPAAAAPQPQEPLGWLIVQEHPDWAHPVVVGARRLAGTPDGFAKEVAALNRGAVLGVRYRLGAVHDHPLPDPAGAPTA